MAEAVSVPPAIDVESQFDRKRIGLPCLADGYQADPGANRFQTVLPVSGSPRICGHARRGIERTPCRSQQLGVHLGIDDFGGGYSSFTATGLFTGAYT